MKKFLFAFIAIAGLNAASHAQTTPVQKKTVPAQTVVKSNAKPQPVTTKVVIPVAGKPKTAALLKADGTPDMRFKANKEGAKAAPAKVKLKKDGTPDKRYKANKKQ